PSSSHWFFHPETSTTEIYTLSLHDALPISVWLSNKPLIGDDTLKESVSISQARIGGAKRRACVLERQRWFFLGRCCMWRGPSQEDRKSTRLNSSHVKISYAVFCLKKKKLEP